MLAEQTKATSLDAGSTKLLPPMILQPLLQSDKHPSDQETLRWDNSPSLHTTETGNTEGFQVCWMGSREHKEKIHSSKQWCIRV